MKKLLFILFLNLFGSLTKAQCAEQNQISIDDTTTRKILHSYIIEANKHLSLTYDKNNKKKGIYQIITYTDEKGRKCISAKTWIDDRYKDNPPSKWGYLLGYILLYYEGDVKGTEQKNTASADFMDCLEIIIGDRVYPRPKPTLRFMEIKDYDILNRRSNYWKVEIDRTKTDILGNDSNNTIFIFEKNGTITSYEPA
jgi:hypothetical protein